MMWSVYTTACTGSEKANGFPGVTALLLRAYNKWHGKSLVGTPTTTEPIHRHIVRIAGTAGITAQLTLNKRTSEQAVELFLAVLW